MHPGAVWPRVQTYFQDGCRLVSGKRVMIIRQATNHAVCKQFFQAINRLDDIGICGETASIKVDAIMTER